MCSVPNLGPERGEAHRLGDHVEHARAPQLRWFASAGVLVVEFGFEQVHGFEEGLLLGGGELVQDACQRLGGAVEPAVFTRP
jgi:hypothetical protein